MMNNKEYTAPTVEVIVIQADVITSSRNWDTPEMPIGSQSGSNYEW